MTWLSVLGNSFILGHLKLLNSFAGIGSWSACKHYNKRISKNSKPQPWLPSQESNAFLAPSVFSHISEFLPWIRMNSRDDSTVAFQDNLHLKNSTFKTNSFTPKSISLSGKPKV